MSISFSFADVERHAAGLAVTVAVVRPNALDIIIMSKKKQKKTKKKNKRTKKEYKKTGREEKTRVETVGFYLHQCGHASKGTDMR